MSLPTVLWIFVTSFHDSNNYSSFPCGLNMQYRLVVESERNVQLTVNKLLDEDWELHGCPTVVIRGEKVEIIQALIKKDD